jgi:hypothetical protein
MTWTLLSDGLYRAEYNGIVAFGNSATEATTAAWAIANSLGR